MEKYQCWFVTLPSNLSDLSPAVVLVLAGPKVVQVDFECHRTTLVGFQAVFSGEAILESRCLMASLPRIPAQLPVIPMQCQLRSGSAANSVQFQTKCMSSMLSDKEQEKQHIFRRKWRLSKLITETNSQNSPKLASFQAQAAASYPAWCWFWTFELDLSSGATATSGPGFMVKFLGGPRILWPCTALSSARVNTSLWP